MVVKAWGNGGNAGWPTQPVRGKGGGGAALKAVYQVEAGQRFYARVIGNYAANAGSHGRAAALHDDLSHGGKLLFVAAGGGGGGSSNYPSESPDGGAGRGARGQPGLKATLLHQNQVIVVRPGLGGTELAGGAGGAGYNGQHGSAGGDYPCDAIYGLFNCGQGGALHGGSGGQGHFGGGGGGSDGINNNTYSVGGAGAGGGASFVYPDPRLIYQHRYDDGDRERPGNADDPDRQGAGAGAVLPDPGTSYGVGATGRIVVTFNTLEIVPEQTTRWKPQRADEVPVDVVFDSPAELQSARLEIKDPAGTSIAVDDQPLELLGSGPNQMYRYKLPWKGPWTREVNGDVVQLPAGNYSVVVHARTSHPDEMVTEPYDRVSLLEVVSVTLRTHPAGQPLPPNPPVPGIPGQVPSQARGYEVPGQSAQPGTRIFAESPSVGAAEVRTVSVRIETFPTITDLPAGAPPIVVSVRSFDVDDPVTGADNFADMDLDASPMDVRDNRGLPRCGSLGGYGLCTIDEIALPPGEPSVSTTLEVSGQPGDNYRVAASTSSDWLGSLFGFQPSSYGEIRVADGSSPLGTPLDADGRACVSEMLTVWRTLHLELDTTTPFPTAPEAFQRNFIRGDVTKITATGAGAGTSIIVRPMQTDPPLGLDDGSPNLTDGNGWGRFQSGTLEIGTASLPFVVDGNGDFHVERAAGFDIPFQLFPPSGLVLNGQVLRWNEDTLTFEMSVNVPALYNGGTLRIAGMSWTGVSVNGPLVIVPPGQDAPLPVFRLWDDDRAALAAPTSDLLTPGTYAPARNILAQAYIEIASLPSSGRTAPFVRNLNSLALPQQLCLGRDTTTVHLARHWSAYIQGTYQASTLADDDPENESASTTLGVTAPQHNSATVFLETVRDAAENPHATCPFGPLCAPWTAVSGVAAHELGHVLGASHDDGDIMSSPGCPCPLKRFFSAKSLNRIRQFTGPATPTACVSTIPNEDSGASSAASNEPVSGRR